VNKPKQRPAQHPLPRPDALIDNDLAEMAQIADDALRTIGNDCDVWAEELARGGTAVLPWPLAVPKDGYQQWLRLFAIAGVSNVLAAMGQARGMSARAADNFAAAALAGDEWEAPECQLVLRVVKRAVDAADRAIRGRFANTGTLGGKRNVLNWLKRHQVARLVAQGLSVVDAAAVVGIGKSAAYRALGRTPPR
jgi:hypothetical protein